MIAEWESRDKFVELAQKKFGEDIVVITRVPYPIPSLTKEFGMVIILSRTEAPDNDPPQFLWKYNDSAPKAIEALKSYNGSPYGGRLGRLFSENFYPIRPKIWWDRIQAEYLQLIKKADKEKNPEIKSQRQQSNRMLKEWMGNLLP